ncbi:MAG: hypothetical protein ACTSQQ_00115 [Candidatus Helarchaeota archaeon]
MSDENEVMHWLKTDFLNNWNRMIEINKNFNKSKALPPIKRRIQFPFIPIYADGYSLRNFLAFFFKYLFIQDFNSFLIIITGSSNAIIWAAIQKIENYSISDLIDLSEYFKVLNRSIQIFNRQKRLEFLRQTLKNNGIALKLDFYLLLNIQSVSTFKEILNNHKNLLDFYSKIWDLIATQFSNKTLQFFPEPLIFKFLRRLSTKNILLKASEFRKIFGDLLPNQNFLLNFLDNNFLSSLIINCQKNSLIFQFPNYDLLHQNLTRYQQSPENDLESLNKALKSTISVEFNQRKIGASVALTLTADIWTAFQKIIHHHSLEHAITLLFKMIKAAEEKWTIERKIILFKRWGKSFMEFQLNQLMPDQPIRFITSIQRFQYEELTRIFWFIVDDSLTLIYILGTEFEHGYFQRLYVINTPILYNLYNSEPDKVTAIKKAHLYFAEHDIWVNQIFAITAQDLNHLITFLPLLTNVKGSLKYLNMIENIMTYRMYFYPPYFFADLIRRKGAVHFFKNLFFPMILDRSHTQSTRD